MVEDRHAPGCGRPSSRPGAPAGRGRPPPSRGRSARRSRRPRRTPRAGRAGTSRSSSRPRTRGRSARAAARARRASPGGRGNARGRVSRRAARRRGREQPHRRDERAAVVELADAGDPDLGAVNPATSSASEPSSTSVSGLRNSSQGAVAGRGGQVARVGEAAVLARDRARLREVPLDQLAGGAAGAVVHDDEVERQPLRVLEQRREAARQPALLVVRDDDHREIVHGRTVASRRGRDSALPRRARGGADARRSSAGRPCGCCAARLQLRAAPVGEGARDEGCSPRSSAAAPAGSARRARCGSTSARAGTSSPAG